MKKDDKILKFVGAKIRSLRNILNISQEELSFRAKLDRTYVSDVELGKRNISLINLNAIAQALEVELYQIFLDYNKATEYQHNTQKEFYIVNDNIKISCGFLVTSSDIQTAALATTKRLESLPFSLFQSINLKALSGMVGAIFALSIAQQVDALVNPIEKGHPDIIPKSVKDMTENTLRNYPEGLEIKCTVGNVGKGSDLQIGQPRLSQLTGVTWQAHHREVDNLMGVIIDFAGKQTKNFFFPVITGIFYTAALTENDWGKISGTTGRNTKVTGMTASGRKKMGEGWILLINDNTYINKYKKLLRFEI